jgi:hypothetical protein
MAVSVGLNQRCNTLLFISNFDLKEFSFLVFYKDSSEQSPLNLINVAGVFYILILGLVLSIFIAVCEVIYKSRIESKKNKVLQSRKLTVKKFSFYFSFR